MQLSVETAIEIDGTPAQVWSVLMDFDAYFEWNPFVLGIQGRPVPGERLRVSMRAPGGARSMTFMPRVLTVNGEREFRWLGRLILPGLFDGEHYFKLEPVGTSGVRLIHGEVFSGILVGLAKGSLLKLTSRAFDEMNAALKRRVEWRRENVWLDDSNFVDLNRSLKPMAPV